MRTLAIVALAVAQSGVAAASSDCLPWQAKKRLFTVQRHFGWSQSSSYRDFAWGDPEAYRSGLHTVGIYTDELPASFRDRSEYSVTEGEGCVDNPAPSSPMDPKDKTKVRTDWFTPSENMSSSCFAVDVETDGRVYHKEVAPEQCVVPRTTPQWVLPTGAVNSSCFALDAETGGKKFRRELPAAKCPKLPTRPQWKNVEGVINSDCFEVDIATGGTLYQHEANRCPVPPLSYRWEDHNVRECMAVDTETMGKNYRHEMDSSKCPKQGSPQAEPDPGQSGIEHPSSDRAE